MHACKRQYKINDFVCVRVSSLTSLRVEPLKKYAHTLTYRHVCVILFLHTNALVQRGKQNRFVYKSHCAWVRQKQQQQHLRFKQKLQLSATRALQKITKASRVRPFFALFCSFFIVLLSQRLLHLFSAERHTHTQTHMYILLK